jgi:hypothetical protein
MGGLYIWQQPMQELSGVSHGAQPQVQDGRSQNVKDGGSGHAPEKHGGSTINDLSKPGIAGSSGQARQSNSSGFIFLVHCRGKGSDGFQGQKTSQRYMC